MSRPRKRQETVVGLVILIEGKLGPFLDSFGRCYCSMPDAEKVKQAVVPLRSRQVRSLLAYGFHEENGEHPGRERISEAIEFVEGKLLAHRRGPVVDEDCPVMRCFLRAVEDDEGGSVSANDILRMLSATNQKHRLLRGAEKLPKNATAMGMWLVKNHFLLQAHGLEVYRPPRGSRKRLWDWRRIVRDDASDTSTFKVSLGVSSPNTKEINDKQHNDALTDEEIANMLPKEALS